MKAQQSCAQGSPLLVAVGGFDWFLGRVNR
jgi:hypothetical protein